MKKKNANKQNNAYTYKDKNIEEKVIVSTIAYLSRR